MENGKEKKGEEMKMNFYLWMAICYAVLMLLFLVMGLKQAFDDQVPKVYGHDKDDTYVEVGSLNQVCWGRSLKRLELLQKDPEITGARMMYGLHNGTGHAWIEYVRNGYQVKYDPSVDKVIVMTKLPEGKKK